MIAKLVLIQNIRMTLAFTSLLCWALFRLLILLWFWSNSVSFPQLCFLKLGAVVVLLVFVDTFWTFGQHDDAQWHTSRSWKPHDTVSLLPSAKVYCNQADSRRQRHVTYITSIPSADVKSRRLNIAQEPWAAASPAFFFEFRWQPLNTSKWKTIRPVFYLKKEEPLEVNQQQQWNSNGKIS